MARNRPAQKYVSKPDLAAMFGVTPRTIDNWAAEGKIRGYRLGRTVRFSLAEVEAAMVPFGGEA